MGGRKASFLGTEWEGSRNKTNYGLLGKREIPSEVVQTLEFSPTMSPGFWVGWKGPGVCP